MSTVATLPPKLDCHSWATSQNSPCIFLAHKDGMSETVPCDGSTTVLSSNTWDDDGDLDTVEWFIDGVKMNSSVTSIPFTTAHELAVVATDARGAVTTATKDIQCGS